MGCNSTWHGLAQKATQKRCHLPPARRDTDDDREATGRGQAGVRRAKRGRRSMFNLRTLLLVMAVVSCFATMIWFFLKSGSLA